MTLTRRRLAASCEYRIPEDLKRSAVEKIAMEVQLVVDNGVNCEEFLSRYWGSEPPPLSLSIACRLMLKYRSIVRSSIAYIPIGETESAQRGGFGSPFQQSAKTLERCFAVSLKLNEDVQNFAPVVNSAPEIVGPDDDPDEDLIKMLASRMLASALAYAPGVETARPKRPMVDGFAGDVDAALSEAILDVPIAQRQA